MYYGSLENKCAVSEAKCRAHFRRASKSGQLIIPRISKSTAGGRSFSYLAPKLWNSLPSIVQEADTLCQFKSRLKTSL